MEKAQIVCSTAVLRYSPKLRNIELLTMLRRRTKRYEFSGGLPEMGETLWDASVRIAKEEICADVYRISNHSSRSEFRTLSGLKEIFVYPVKLITAEPRIADPDKFEKFLWMPIKRYLDSRLPTADYVRNFARETHATAYNESFRKEISSLESII